MLTTAWKNVKQQTIANCFAKAGFQQMSDTNTGGRKLSLMLVSRSADVGG
jgi:hypothetical protein